MPFLHGYTYRQAPSKWVKACAIANPEGSRHAPTPAERYTHLVDAMSSLHIGDHSATSAYLQIPVPTSAVKVIKTWAQLYALSPSSDSEHAPTPQEREEHLVTSMAALSLDRHWVRAWTSDDDSAVSEDMDVDMEDISIGVTQASPTGPSVEQRGYEDVSEAEDVDMQSYETSADSSSTGPSAVDQPDTREEFKKEVRQPLKETAPYTPRFWHTRPAPVKASRPKSSVPTARPKPQILSQPNAPKAVAIIIPQPPANAEDSSFVKKLLMAGITVAFFALNGY